MVENRIGILVGRKGRGSNMCAIARACLSGQIPATAAVVISPIENEATEAARSLDLTVAELDPKADGYAVHLLACLREHAVSLVCLAGYMSLLPALILDEFPDRVLNIHPALLPNFGGQGMYGHHVHEAVLAAGASESGCTVHIVSDEYDKGPIVRQMRCPVLPGDTVETLAARVLALEHLTYPEAIRDVLSQRA